MIEAKIICDSISSAGVRLTTFVLTYPRYIHSEFMTHRMFSRNASSSRAIPVAKQIQMVEENPAVPSKFFKNQKGMQGTELLVGEEAEQAKALWLQGRDQAVVIAKQMLSLNIHKQHINRILEPWAFISVVVTATEYANFFHLRYHKDADPTIQELAIAMWNEYSSSKPQELEDGEWHAPFTNSPGGMVGLAEQIEMDSEPKLRLKRSVAKCARVSYLTHEGKQSTSEQDLELYDRLVGGNPLHASPTEHQAMACGDPNVRSGNFLGWIQYRKTLKGENVTNFPEGK
jgi:thymidylate synthase ThyX